MGLNSSAFSNARIKAEQLEDNDKSYNDDNDGTKELFNSALVEDLNSNEKVLSDINRFIASQRDRLNKKNLVNYCGILDHGS